MTSKSTSSIVLIILSVFASTGLQTLAQDQAMLGQASASVVRVESHQCQVAGKLSSDRTATGFVWRDSNTVVTALHVVSGCGNIVVSYTNPSTVAAKAVISKLSNFADLALLSVTSPPDGITPLDIDSATPPMTVTLEALGFPLKIPTMSSTELTVRFGGKKLRDIVPTAVSQDLYQAKSPSLDLPITNLEGHLLPGLSGAPILNPKGKVVAIGDGGLEGGTVGIAWSVPVSNLLQLPQSTDPIPTATSTSKSLFSAETDAAVLGSIDCGGHTLTEIRHSSFQQIAKYTDDPLGLQQIVTVFSVDTSGMSFDIYQDLASGATVTVPSGTTLQSRDYGCSADLADGDFTMKVQLTQVDSPLDAQQKSLQTELVTVGGNPAGWMVDTALTTLAPVSRQDGLTVRRKAYDHINPALIAPNADARDQFIFETFAERGSMMITVSLENTVADSVHLLRAAACLQKPDADGCDKINEKTKEWKRGLVAVHLATFPIG